MDYKEIIKSELETMLIETFDTDQIQMIENALILSLRDYDLVPKERSVVVYDNSDYDLLQRYFLAKAVQGLTPRSMVTYKNVLTKFFSSVNKRIKEVSPDDIRIYLAKKKIDKVSDSYLALIHRSLSSFYSWICQEDLSDNNPIAKVQRIKTRKKEEKPLSVEDMEKLRSLAMRSSRDSAVIELLYSTGCRVSELCAINRDDVDLDKMSICVMGKGRKYRNVYISVRAKYALERYLKTRTDNNPALFCWAYEDISPHVRELRGMSSSDDVQRFLPSGVRCMFNSYGKKMGMRIHPHLIRKTIATHALKKGMPIEQVRVMLGHESIATTTIYAQTAEDDVRSAHERFV